MDDAVSPFCRRQIPIKCTMATNYINSCRWSEDKTNAKESTFHPKASSPRLLED